MGNISEELHSVYVSAGMPSRIWDEEEASRWRDSYMDLAHMQSKPKWTIPFLAIFECYMMEDQGNRTLYRVAPNCVTKVAPSQDHNYVLELWDKHYAYGGSRWAPKYNRKKMGHRFYGVFETIQNEKSGEKLGDHAYAHGVVGLERISDYSFEDGRWRHKTRDWVSERGHGSTLKDHVSTK